MAWITPTLEDIAQRTRQAFQTHLPGSDATIFPSNIYVSAKVIASRIWEVFHRLDYIQDQAFPLTATGLYLDRHAQQFGITRKPETPATGQVSVVGGIAGTVVPSGTLLQRQNGTQFETTEEVVLSVTELNYINVDASVGGSSGNTDADTTLTFLTAITGAPSTATVGASGLASGAAVESDDALRLRLLSRLQTPSAPGSSYDYIRWAESIPGVTRAWVQSAAFGAGTVGVWFAMDNSYENGIPLAADVAVVQAYIDTQSPITANVTVAAPIAEPIPIQITGLYPFTTSVIADVKAELKNMISERAEVSTSSTPAYIRRSWVWQAVANATGERYHTVLLPNVDFQITDGYLPVYDESYVSISE